MSLPTDIKEHFRSLIVPKEVQLKVEDTHIEMVSSNTNYYTIGFYSIIMLFFVAISIPLQAWKMLYFCVPFAILSLLNLKSRTIIRLEADVLTSKEGLFETITIPLKEILSVFFSGKMKNYGLTISGVPISGSTACMKIKLRSGRTVSVARMANKQKFMYHCVLYFVDRMKPEPLQP
jgi:hypothetical protein